MRAILFIILFALTLLGENSTEKILIIPKGKVALESKEYLYYIKEDEKHQTPEQILKSTELSLAKVSGLGVAQGPFWTKLTIRNSEDFKELFLYSPHAGANLVDTYVFEDGVLISHHLLGDLQPQETREILSRFSLFPLKLTAHQELTIIAKIENYGIYRIGWVIEDAPSFLNKENNIDFLYGIISGFVIFYLIYAFLLFRTTKKLGFLMLMIESFSITCYMLAVYGILYRLDIGLSLELITFLAFFAIYAATIVRILFVYYFFDMRGRYKFLSKLVLLMGTIALIMTIHIIYSIYIDIGAFYYMKYHFYFYIFYPLVLIAIGIYFWKKREPGSIYFLLGQSILAVASFINVLSVFGLIEHQWYTPYLLNYALIFDSCFMLTLQYYRVKKEQTKALLEKNYMQEQSRFFTIGQAIGNITHQWKEPLSHLGSSLTMLDSLLQKDEALALQKLKERIDLMQSSSTLMRNTIDEFSIFYTTKTKKEDFVPLFILQKQLLPLLKSKQTLKNATITLDVQQDLQIFGHTHQFINILMVLISNALDAFEKDSNTQNNITITITKQNGIVSIVCIDNAGGIKIKPIERIFEYFVSDKKDENITGHGIGLPMIKTLIEEQLKGTITVKNTTDGSCFSISFSDS